MSDAGGRGFVVLHMPLSPQLPLPGKVYDPFIVPSAATTPVRLTVAVLPQLSVSVQPNWTLLPLTVPLPVFEVPSLGTKVKVKELPVWMNLINSGPSSVPACGVCCVWKRNQTPEMLAVWTTAVKSCPVTSPLFTLTGLFVGVNVKPAREGIIV
jgi:hypothetical protein